MPACSSRRSAAATLIELLTVMAILAILGSIAIGAISGSKQRTLIARTRTELAALTDALEAYRRHYGDYPQLGEFTHAAVAPASATTTPGFGTAEAKLFNSLTGVFGPKNFGNADRLSGPNFLAGSRFLDANSGALNGTLQTTFLVPTANADRPPSKAEQNVCLLDPWGRRYLYYYKNARTPAAWLAPSYVLYSTGPDGAHAPPPANGVMTSTQLTAASNADNIYANP